MNDLIISRQFVFQFSPSSREEDYTGPHRRYKAKLEMILINDDN